MGKTITKTCNLYSIYIYVCVCVCVHTGIIWFLENNTIIN